MAGFNGLVLTKQGIELMLKVHANQCNIELTRVAVGDGKLQTGYNLEDLTGLMHELLSFGINKVEVLDTNCVRVEARINNTSLSQGIYIREIGLFAKEPDGKEILYAVGNSREAADYLPASGIDVVEEIIGISISVGNTENLKLNINESLWYISKKEFQKEIADLRNPYIIIPQGTDIPIHQRKEGKLYFKVTDRQSNEEEINNDVIKVSQSMGIKINGGNSANVRVNPIMGIKIE